MAANPFADPLRFEQRVAECAIVIFGASGDLSKRKLMPALYRLAYDGKLPPSFSILGNSRSKLTDDEFRSRMHDAVKEFLEDGPLDEELWESFAANLYYIAGDANDPDVYARIKEKLKSLDQSNALYYLSTQPSHYEPIIERLGEAGLAKECSSGWRRIVIEKPFGHDLESARNLNAAIHRVFTEEQTYRIDHYLGKETVQNVMAFRFGNGIFEPLWNRRYVNHVQITAAESIGVEGRGAFYQEAGALRDMIQSHLLQVTATIAMEPAAGFDPDALRDERAKLLRSIRIMPPQDVATHAVAGQYRGFREEKDVRADSMTETYAAATFYIDNWRWSGIPFYIRTGKKLPKRVTDIAIQFNAAPNVMFSHGSNAGNEGSPEIANLREDAASGAHAPNLLLLRIQPEEGISLRFQSKQPGSGMRLRPVSMDFNYGSSFGARSPSAYETLLVDVLKGDPTLYTRQDMVEASWRVVQPILDDWKSRKFDFPNYEPGSWGPKESDEMLAKNGHRWRNG
jgi:glucose-6-phosphate 1-dehydrogenase